MQFDLHGVNCYIRVLYNVRKTVIGLQSCYSGF